MLSPLIGFSVPKRGMHGYAVAQWPVGTRGDGRRQLPRFRFAVRGFCAGRHAPDSHDHCSDKRGSSGHNFGRPSVRNYKRTDERHLQARRRAGRAVRFASGLRRPRRGHSHPARLRDQRRRHRLGGHDLQDRHHRAGSCDHRPCPRRIGQSSVRLTFTATTRPQRSPRGPARSTTASLPLVSRA